MMRLNEVQLLRELQRRRDLLDREHGPARLNEVQLLRELQPSRRRTSRTLWSASMKYSS